MITKLEAKAAWQTIKSFSMMHTSDTYSVDDVTVKVQKAVMTLEKYFEQEEKQ